MVEVITLGESMGSLRSAGLVKLGGQVSLSVAGAESNVAIGLSRLGHSCAWVGVVGQDQVGDLVLRTLQAEGVELPCARRSERPTGIVIFESRLKGRIRVDYHRRGSAGSTLAAQDILTPLARHEPRVVHLTGVTMAIGPEPADAVVTAARAGAAGGAVVAFDVNFRSQLWNQETARGQMSAVVEHVDVLIASEDELALVANGNSTPERARDLLARGVEVVVVKRGVDGATSYRREGVVAAPADQVVAADVVGAGDAFVAGYLSALLDGLGEPARLARANRVGAFAVASHGDWEGLPTRAELTLLDEGTGDVVR